MWVSNNFFLAALLNTLSTEIEHELNVNHPKIYFLNLQNTHQKYLNTKSNLSPQPPLVGDGGSRYRLKAAGCPQLQI